MSAPLLFELLPALAGRLPWLRLATRPTPVDDRLVAGRRVLVKRDDLSAVPYGGNKVRKLEFLLAGARQAGARHVITAGAFGSHHALATAIYGRNAGFQVTCVLFPQPVTPHVRAVLRLIAASGAELRFTRRLEGVPLALRRARWRARSEGVVVIPPGGSSPLGALGYVDAALELDAQIRTGACPEPGCIHVAAGTLGTAAGIAVGLALAGRSIPLQATRITSPLVTNQRALRSLVRGVLRLLEPAATTVPSAADVLRPVVLRHDQVGEGYGRDTPAARAAAEAFAGIGLQLDGTYTAKAAAALLADPPVPGPPLFWHTLSGTMPDSGWPAPPTAAVPEPFRTLLQG